MSDDYQPLEKPEPKPKPAPAPKPKAKTDPDLDALRWLEKNCAKFTIHANQRNGTIQVEGVISAESKQGGYIERYLPKVYRQNGAPPYLIHPESTFKVYREVDFKYYATGETLADAVQMISATYCPGDKKVYSQEFAEDRYADYSNVTLWVLPAETYDLTLDDFSKLQTVGLEQVNRTLAGL